MKVLVTGGLGYLGSEVVAALKIRGHEVVTIDRGIFNGDFGEDFRDITVDSLEGVDAIFHLAAVSNDPAGELDQKFTYHLNCDSAVGLAEKASIAGVPAFIFPSSASVYGAGRDLTIDSPKEPVSTYAKSKWRAEQELGNVAQGLKIGRLGTLHGLSPQRMRFDLAVNIMTLYAVRKGRIFVTGGGLQVRPLLHVRDAARGLIYLWEHQPNGAYNLATENVRMIDLAMMIGLQQKVPVEVVPDDPDRRDYEMRASPVIPGVPTLHPESSVEIAEAIRAGNLLEAEAAPNTLAVWKHIVNSVRAQVVYDGA